MADGTVSGMGAISVTGFSFIALRIIHFKQKPLPTAIKSNPVDSV